MDELANLIAKAYYEGFQGKGDKYTPWEELSAVRRVNSEFHGEFVAKRIREQFDVVGKR